MAYDFKTVEKNGKINGTQKVLLMLKMIIQKRNGMG